MMELMAPDVASDIKANKVCPRIRYKAKFSIWNLKKVEKTAVSTIIIKRGFNTDHTIPKALLRYFSLKSLDTNDFKINQSC